MVKNGSTKEALPPLLAAVPRDRWPKHIAIIMDGNGRWAQRRGWPRVAGHREGAKVVRRITEECARLGLERLTLYAFSHENWQRPKDEVAALMRLYEEYLKSERPVIMKNDIRFASIGREAELPEGVRREAALTREQSRNNTGLTLCLAVNYGGRQEIVDAAKGLAVEARAGRLDPATIDEAALAAHLYPEGAPEVDLLVRTAGEMRVSNFLLWQISYAEFYVTEALWPDFTEPELHQAIAAFAQRDRRFGGLDDAEE